jgi:hypothetical protein
MLNLDKILEDYAKEINAQVIPYTDNKSAISFPTGGVRFQQVIGWSKQTEHHKLVEFHTKVCKFTNELNFEKLLEDAASYTFARVIVKDGYLQVATAAIVDHATPELIKDLVKEAALVADKLEMMLTGQDVH